MKKELIDMLHQKCGRLTIISRAPNKNTRAYWNCLCECGNTKIVSGKKLRTGQTQSCGCLRKDTCKETAINQRHSEIYVKQKLQENGYELLSSYEGIQKPVTCKCLVCNHIFTRRAQTNLYNQHGCPRCAFQNNSILTEKYFQLNPELKEKLCKVYLINLTNNKENFYKIGITTRKLEKRFKNIPYEVNNIKTIDTTYYNAYKLEKSLKETIKPYQYYPKIKFNGAGECFIT